MYNYITYNFSAARTSRCANRAQGPTLACGPSKDGGLRGLSRSRNIFGWMNYNCFVVCVMGLLVCTSGESFGSPPLIIPPPNPPPSQHAGPPAPRRSLLPRRRNLRAVPSPPASSGTGRRGGWADA